jgi:hypothetical protein
VASCTRPSTAGSVSSESTLSPPPESPGLGPANTIAVQNRGGNGDYRSVIEIGDVVDNSLGQNQPASQQDGATLNQINQTTNNQNSSQENAEEMSSQLTANQNPVQDGDKGDFAGITIAPYISGQFDRYEYEAIKGVENKEDDQEGDLKDDDPMNDLEDPKVSDELKPLDEEDNLDDPATPNNEVDTSQVIEEDLYGADTPRAEPATPQIIDDDIYGADTPLPEPATPATPQVIEEEDIYGADIPRAETPTPLGAGEFVEESNINGAEAIKASEALTNALLETTTDVSALEVPAEPTIGGADIPQPPKIDGADLPVPSQATVNSENRVDSEVASQIAADVEEKVEKVVFKYNKFTPAAAFEDFLKNADKMSYHELYHRTAVVADALKAYQDEYDEVNQQLFSYEKRKATLKEIADEEKKVAEEKRKVENKEAIMAEDQLLMDLFKKYEGKLRFRSSKWLAFLTEFEHNGGEPQDVERLKRLHEPVFVSALAKRFRLLQKEAEKKKKVPLVGGDLPPLKKSDREPHLKKRKIVQDRIVFEDKKQSDVYQQPYNSKMYGNQRLKDRNAADFGGEDEFNENGRPKRSTAKRAFYDTEQSDTAPDTEPENLPAKRARTKRVLDDGIASPGRPQTLFESRDGTPARVFPSGKRIGRPPGSKTKNPGGKAAQSKLNTVQVAEPSESEADIGEAQNNQPESHAQELAPAQQQQLHAAASSLVAQTEEANSASGAPIKKKHAGGRPKKNIAIEEPVAGPSNAPVEETPIAPKPKNKGGRPRKHPVPAGGAKGRGGRAKKQPAAQQPTVQVGEEEEVIQSTEHDNESLFPSTSTSRPTTSSSGGTDATFGGRQTRRATTRGKSQAQSASIEEQLDAPGPSVSTNGKGKRKRTITEDIQPTQPFESAAQSDDSEGENIVVDTYRPGLFEEFASPPKKRKQVRGKRGKATAQSAPQPILTQQEVTPEQAGDALNNTTGRPKRKRAAALPESSIDPDQLGDYLSDDDGETPPPPKRRNARGRKGRSVKREQTTDIDTGVDGDSSVPPSRKRAARAVTKRNTIKQEMLDEESSGDQVPQPPQTRKSRTNTLIVAETGPIGLTGGSMEGEIGEGFSTPALKKRNVSGGKQAAKDVETLGENIVSKKRKAPVSKGKGVALGDIIEPGSVKNEGADTQNGSENAGFEWDGHDITGAEPPAKKRKTRTVKGKAAKTESMGDDDFSDSEDYTGMDPEQAELLRKKKRKSKKLAAATKKRWANGTMKGPMEKRKATNAAKKAAKLAAKQLGGLDGTVDTASIARPAGPTADADMRGMGGIAGPAGDASGAALTGGHGFQGGANDNVVGSMTGGTMAAPAVAAPARISTRVRKPTSRAMGLDGADDSDEGEFRSEYDHFQALSSPKGAALGKRARKSYVDLEDDEDSY